MNETQIQPTRSLRPMLLTGAFIALGIGATAAGVAVAAGGRHSDTHLVPGIRIAGVPVGGLSPEEAGEKLRTWARARMDSPVVLKAPVSGRKWACTVGELAGRFQIDEALKQAVQVGESENFFQRLIRGDRDRNVQIEPAFVFAQDKLDARLKRIAAEIRRAPRNARAKMDPKTGVLMLARREEPGVTLDIDATRKALLGDDPQSLADGAQAELVVQEERPKITAQDLGKLGTLLGGYTTDYSSSSSNRKHNVWLAASKIDGTLLAPGESFSYNTTVGAREANLGWRMAHQYQDGQVVDGIGGGVCQVSSTLYNAALLAGLKIVERHNHSMPVAYLRAGRDATVSYNSLDFRFQNSTDGPVYVSARADGDRLSFRIFGAAGAAARPVRIETSDRSYTRSGGFTVSAWRVFQNPDGTTERESLGSNYYRPPAPKATPVKPKPRAIAKPVVKPTPPPVAPLLAPPTVGVRS